MADAEYRRPRVLADGRPVPARELDVPDYRLDRAPRRRSRFLLAAAASDLASTSDGRSVEVLRISSRTLSAISVCIDSPPFFVAAPLAPKPQDFLVARADPREELGFPGQTMPEGWDEALELRSPISLGRDRRATDEQVDHRGDGGRRAGRGSEQGRDAPVGRSDHFGPELELADQLPVLLDLSWAPAAPRCRASSLRPWLRAGSRRGTLDPRRGRLQHLADEVGGEAEIPEPGGEHGDDIGKLERAREVEVGAGLEEFPVEKPANGPKRRVFFPPMTRVSR